MAVQLHLRAAADHVCEASPALVQQCLAELVVKGHLANDVMPASEELPLVDEEEEYTAEVDYSDEDIYQNEPDAMPQLADGSGPFLSESAYSIVVRRLPGGGVALDVPEIGGEAYRALTSLGEQVLGNLSHRRQIYAAIADWLQREYASNLTGTLDDFLDQYKALKQTEFLKNNSLKLDKSVLSKSLNNATLVLGDGELPLRKLFERTESTTMLVPAVFDFAEG